MHSLFAKILGWFVLTLLATVAAIVLTTALTYDSYSARQAPFSMVLGLELSEARHAWEHGGAAELRPALQRFRDVTHASQVILTDGNGMDLLTGQSHAATLRASLGWIHFPFRESRIEGGEAFTRHSADRKYCLIAVRDTWYFWFLQPAHLGVIALVVLLCWALARYLTAPLRQLGTAVDRFGHGDLTARARESRKDELGELAAAFNRMADRIQTLLAAERRLLFDISHELRSPLARLSVAVELARPADAPAPLLDRIQKEADRLNDLIQQTLEIARAEGDASRRETERLRLDELVEELVEACSIEAQAHGCALALSAAGPVTIDGNSELLRRAIENVLRNAIRYAPAGSQVEIGLANGGGCAQIRIRDYGPGVPAEALPFLFDPFYRVEEDRDRKSGGAGLGLSIARRAVELHRGSLRASNASPGLLVEIELPV